MKKNEEVEHLTVVNNTVQYLSHTIDDFREFFRPDKARKEFNLKNCYKKASNLVESKYKSLSIEVINNLVDINIYSLENELIQVLINLLNNAKDALAEKDRQRKLIFTDIYIENKNAILTIKDNGGGVPENIIDNIFEPYFTTKELNGTGIGLNMSKEIIVGHLNGEISVKKIVLILMMI